MYCLCRKRAVGVGAFVCCHLLLFITALTVEAQPGRPDTTFTAEITGAAGGANVVALAPLPDGRLLIGGNFVSVNGYGQSDIARLRTNGMRDFSFIGRAQSAVNVLAIDASNRVVVGGALTNVSANVVTNIARVFFDGAPDTNFSAAINGAVNAIAFQPGGKILVGGSFSRILEPGVSKPKNITRLNEDGSDDEAFSPTDRGANASVWAFAIQPDGKILVGGSFTLFDGEPRAGLVRLNADTTFD